MATLASRRVKTEGSQTGGKLRTPTDHELPRGFPGGALAVSTLGIKERQDGRPPDLTTPRGRHATAALVTGGKSRTPTDRLIN